MTCEQRRYQGRLQLWESTVVFFFFKSAFISRNSCPNGRKTRWDEPIILSRNLGSVRRGKKGGEEASGGEPRWEGRGKKGEKVKEI